MWHDVVRLSMYIRQPCLIVGILGIVHVRLLLLPSLISLPEHNAGLCVFLDLVYMQIAR